jgi:hypothetical protein
MRIFIPIEDGHVERDVVPVPYLCGMPCVHGLRDGFAADAEGWLHYGADDDPRPHCDKTVRVSRSAPPDAHNRAAGTIRCRSAAA